MQMLVESRCLPRYVLHFKQLVNGIFFNVIPKSSVLLLLNLS